MQRRTAWLVVAAFGCTLLATLVVLAEGRPGSASHMPRTVAGGDAERGRLAIRRLGCASCHSIPGVGGANGQVGPPLRAVANQSYIGGVLPNLPENMVRWILDPQSVDPRSAMPDVGATEAEARDIAAYLYGAHPGGWM
ncbi:MAG TPA: c-type cytochrome [Falsiroseomonas sp.]|jgi:cytochrome c1|nr:c-type cytochrome [Falsiroseomonas sp.]